MAIMTHWWAFPVLMALSGILVGLQGRRGAGDITTPVLSLSLAVLSLGIVIGHYL